MTFCRVRSALEVIQDDLEWEGSADRAISDSVRTIETREELLIQVQTLLLQMNTSKAASERNESEEGGKSEGEENG